MMCVFMLWINNRQMCVRDSFWVLYLISHCHTGLSDYIVFHESLLLPVQVTEISSFVVTNLVMDLFYLKFDVSWMLKYAFYVVEQM